MELSDPQPDEISSQDFALFLDPLSGDVRWIRCTHTLASVKLNHPMLLLHDFCPVSLNVSYTLAAYGEVFHSGC